MERLVIEQLEGVNRNAVEGVTNAPAEVRNLAFKRDGGLIPLGGIDTTWSLADFGASTLLAYDEATLALLSGPRVWIENTLVDLTGPEFVNASALALAPRAAILAPFQAQGDSLVGSPWFRAPDGAFQRDESSGAPGAITTVAGTGVPAGEYEFVWFIERRTDNGLVATAVGRNAHTAGVALESITLTLGVTFPVGTVARFYYRRITDDRFERFSAQVSTGSAPMAATLEDLPTVLLPTSDVLVNFGGGRLESHLNRMWGRASTQAFAALIPASQQVRVGGYMLMSAASVSEERQRGTVSAADMGFRSPSDYIDITFERLTVRRKSISATIVVPLFSSRKTANTNIGLIAWLEYAPGDNMPRIRARARNGGARAEVLFTRFTSMAASALRLGTALSSEATALNVSIRITLDSTSVVNTYLVVKATARVQVGGLTGFVSPTLSNSWPLATEGYATLSTSSIVSFWVLQRTANSGASWTTVSSHSAPATFTSNLSYLTDNSTVTRFRILSSFAFETGAVFRLGFKFLPQALSSYAFSATPSVQSVISVEVWFQGALVVSLPHGTVGAGATINPFTNLLGYWADEVRVVATPTADLPPESTFELSYFQAFSQNSGSGGTWENDYRPNAQTSLGLGRLAGTASINAIVEARVLSLESGDGAPSVKARGDIEDYETGETWTSATGESWQTNSAANMVLEFVEEAVDGDVNPIVQPDITLVYSDTGSVNRGRAANFLPLSPLASSRITALASTPAGLLVFMENETFLVRGDAATQNLAVQRLSGTLGCDPGVIPARLGSVVMPIYKGEVYAVNLGGGDVDFGGNIVNVSRPIWTRDDPFVQVVGDNSRNHIVARTMSGAVYRLDTSEQKWLTDPFDGNQGLEYLIPAGLDSENGARYIVAGRPQVVNRNLLDAPVIRWEALDAGDKNGMKLWRRVELFTEGAGDGAPVLRYSARGASGQVNGLDLGGGRWVFTLRRGVVSPTIDLEFEFPGVTGDFVLEPPLVVEYAPRYRQR